MHHPHTGGSSGLDVWGQLDANGGAFPEPAAEGPADEEV